MLQAVRGIDAPGGVAGPSQGVWTIGRQTVAFVSSSIRRNIIRAELHDTGVNLSDHIYQFVTHSIGPCLPRYCHTLNHVLRNIIHGDGINLT